MYGASILFSRSPFNFYRLREGEGGQGGLRLLLSVAAIPACTPADRKASAWNILFVCASIVHFSRTGWVGGKGC